MNDIRKYFDPLKQEWLRKFLDRRVRDGVIRRLIGKWLKAGVWENGPMSYPEETKSDQASGPKPGTFDFLGFTHCWGKSRQGRWVIRRQTLRKRLTRGLKAISQWCRKNLHESLFKQVEQLGRKLNQGMPWARMNRLLDLFYLPKARVVHSIYAAKP